MKQKNKFDLVMDYVDANIQEDVDTIKKGIYNLIGYNSNSFGNCFSVLTNYTLYHYISERRMYFAGKELYENPQKSICDIALGYGYSDQSAFTRAMKSFCNCTPTEVRKGIKSIPNKKYSLTEFNSENGDTRTQRIFSALKNNDDISTYNFELLIGLENASEEYGFDFDTCCKIADLAEKLDVSPLSLIEKCFELVEEEYHNYGLKESNRIAIECGIESTEELNAICEYFDCKYYDLDSFMVMAYREQTIVGKESVI